MTKKEHADWIIEKNKQYRLGNPTVSDPTFDKEYISYCELYPDDYLSQKGILEELPIDDNDKELLPIGMFSLKKLKSIPELKNWLKSNNIPEDADIVISAKYDSISMCSEECVQSAFTRGDGTYGKNRTTHTPHIQYITEFPSIDENQRDFYSYGEAIIPKAAWSEYFEGKISPKTDKLYKAGRNTVSGMFINKDAQPELLKHVVYMRYGLVQKSGVLLTKEAQLNLLNCLNVIEVPFIILKLNDENLEQKLNDAYEEWNKTFEIDGLVLDLNDTSLIEDLGRAENGNPIYAMAYKNPEWAQVEITNVNKISKEVSKQGTIVPVMNINPVIIGGVEVKRATGYNMKYMLDNNICEGSIVEIIRSGDVIPKHINTISFDEQEFEKFKLALETCHCCGTKTIWSDTKVDLICPNVKCPDRVLSGLVNFFAKIKIDKFGEGEITKLFKKGYDTPEKILNITHQELISLDGWGESKIKTLFNQFNQFKSTGLPLANIIHALDLYSEVLGEKVAQKIFDEYTGSDDFETISMLLLIDGVGDITAEAFMKAYKTYKDNYSDFVIKPSYIKTPKKELLGDKYMGKSICMTGFRDAELKELIETHGGKVTDGVSKKTNILIVADLNTTSGKAEKARDFKIPIVTKNQFLEL